MTAAVVAVTAAVAVVAWLRKQIAAALQTIEDARADVLLHFEEDDT
jgi:hypothetical protein